MIDGAHVIIYSKDAEADRAFFRDVLGLPWVDAGHDWLIFALPPGEVAVHPAGDDAGGDAGDDLGHELYLLCDDLVAEMEALAAKGVVLDSVEEARWGSVTRVHLPGGGKVGLYQPRHPLALTRSAH